MPTQKLYHGKADECFSFINAHNEPLPFQLSVLRPVRQSVHRSYFIAELYYKQIQWRAEQKQIDSNPRAQLLPTGYLKCCLPEQIVHLYQMSSFPMADPLRTYTLAFLIWTSSAPPFQCTSSDSSKSHQRVSDIAVWFTHQHSYKALLQMMSSDMVMPQGPGREPRSKNTQSQTSLKCERTRWSDERLQTQS